MDIRTLPVDHESFWWSIKAFFLSLFIAKYSCKGITFISPFMQEYCFKKVGLSNKRTSIWSSGFKKEIFDPDKYQKDNPEGQFNIFYHGGISLSRGIGSLVQAIKILRDKGYPVSLRLVGNIVDEKKIINIIRQNQIEEFCEIIPPVPYEMIPKMIKDCDLPIIPLPNFIGWRASSPIKLMEYMAMGKSMVLTDIEAHRDVVDSNRFAFFARTAEAEGLATAIEQAYKMRDNLESLGKSARELALAKYTWESQAQELILFLKSIIHE